MTYFLHPNHLGSTTFVTDQTGATIQKTVYYPYGTALWGLAGTLKDNRFASMDPRDGETNNDPTLFRIYNSRLYRWLSPDPMGGDIMNPQSLNRYAYVMNNPVNFIDPLGLQQEDNDNWCASNSPNYPECVYGSGNHAYNPYGGCYFEGVNVYCEPLYDLARAGGAVQCPGNVCRGTAEDNAGNSRPVQFVAFTGLAQVVSGYFALSGPGGLYYTERQAGIGSSTWGSWYMNKTGREVGGSIWCAYGICSSTLQTPGAPGELSFMMTINFTEIPHFAQGTGWWRTTVGEFSPSSDYSWMLGSGNTLYTGTSSGRVLMVGPTTGRSECVLIGPSMPGELLQPCGP